MTSLRYCAGYSLVLVSRLLKSIFRKLLWIAYLPERFSLIVWTPREIEMYARADWNSRSAVENYSGQNDWVVITEKTLVETYFNNGGELLNIACGAGREALLLALRGLKVTACDWSPRLIAEAERRAKEANLPVRFVVADMVDLSYPEHSFDYLLLTNNAYGYVFPRHRRIHFLQQVYSMLRPQGIFIVSFARAIKSADGKERFLQRLFMRLRQYAPFNRDYEPGDTLAGSFLHRFEPEELRQEFEETKFRIKDWLWYQGYAVLTKVESEPYR